MYLSLYFPGLNPFIKDSFLLLRTLRYFKFNFKVEHINIETPEFKIVYTAIVEIACL